MAIVVVVVATIIAAEITAVVDDEAVVSTGVARVTMGKVGRGGP